MITKLKVSSIRQISDGTQSLKQARAMSLLSLMGHVVKIYFPDAHHYRSQISKREFASHEQISQLKSELYKEDLLDMTTYTSVKLYKRQRLPSPCIQC